MVEVRYFSDPVNILIILDLFTTTINYGIALSLWYSILLCEWTLRYSVTGTGYKVIIISTAGNLPKGSFRGIGSR